MNAFVDRFNAYSRLVQSIMRRVLALNLSTNAFVSMFLVSVFFQTPAGRAVPSVGVSWTGDVDAEL